MSMLSKDELSIEEYTLAQNLQKILTSGDRSHWVYPLDQGDLDQRPYDIEEAPRFDYNASWRKTSRSDIPTKIYQYSDGSIAEHRTLIPRGGRDLSYRMHCEITSRNMSGSYYTAVGNRIQMFRTLNPVDEKYGEWTFRTHHAFSELIFLRGVYENDQKHGEWTRYDPLKPDVIVGLYLFSHGNYIRVNDWMHRIECEMNCYLLKPITDIIVAYLSVSRGHEEDHFGFTHLLQEKTLCELNYVPCVDYQAKISHGLFMWCVEPYQPWSVHLLTVDIMVDAWELVNMTIMTGDCIFTSSLKGSIEVCDTADPIGMEFHRTRKSRNLSTVDIDYGSLSWYDDNQYSDSGLMLPPIHSHSIFNRSFPPTLERWLLSLSDLVHNANKC